MVKFIRVSMLSAAVAGCTTVPSPPPGPWIVDDGPIPRPAVTSVSPARGSTAGGTAVAIFGSGFQLGATVTLGGRSQAVTVGGSTVLYVTTTAQDAGVVEMVITGPQGQVERFAAAFEYAPQPTFDFSGSWVGGHPSPRPGPVSQPNEHMDVRFAITGGVVRSIRITCEGIDTALPSLLVVSLGEFSVTADAGVVIAGRIVSDRQAIGTIDTPECPGMRWSAVKK